MSRPFCLELLMPPAYPGLPPLDPGVVSSLRVIRDLA
jgi:hypothetical protein